MICERCGRSSNDTKICPYCNASDVGNEESDGVRDSGEWGWAEISIAAVPSAYRPKAVAAIRKRWQEIEHFTVLKLLNSQASALEFEDLNAKLLVRRDLLTSLIEKVKREAESLSFTFTPVNTPLQTAADANIIINLTELKKLNLKELKMLKNEVTEEIAKRKLDDIKEAREKIFSIAKRVGVPIGELIETTQKKQKAGKSLAVQVQHPNHVHSKETR